MLLLKRLLCLAAILLAGVEARSSTGDGVLVVVEPEQRQKYSIFFQNLRGRGYDLTFRVPKAAEPPLMEFDTPAFSHVIILAAEPKHLAKDLSPQALIDAVSRDVNILVALPQKQTPLSTFAAEFSLILPPPSTSLISYFPEREDAPNVIPVSPPKEHPIITSDLNPVWFTGIPHALGNNPFLIPILRAPPQSFAGELGSPAEALVEAAEKGGEGLWAGRQLGIVTGFQALNNVRVTFVGGAELFSDEFARKDIHSGIKSGNTQFADDIAAWTFQESNVFRIDKVVHRRLNTTVSRDKYTVNDYIEFTTYISKYNAQTSTWAPYSGLHDLQLEFTMLDPHIRMALPPSGVAGKYSVTFRAPDRHGVFKFVINHRRKGMTYLQSSTTVAVVPPRHDEYPRFLSAAWPYYTGAVSTSIGFVIFSALWLAGGVRQNKGKREENGCNFLGAPSFAPMKAAPSLSLRTASSRIPSLSTSSSSLSSTFSDISFSSSSSIPSPPSTSSSKTHAFFAFRSHSPEPILRQKTAPSADVSATPTPPSILKSQSSGPSGLHPDLDNGSLAIYRKTDCNLDQPEQSFLSSPSDEPTPRPTNATPASFFASAVETIPSASRRTSPALAKEQSSVDLLLHNAPPNFASTTPDSSSQTFITGQNTDTTLRLLHALGQGSFSSVWLAEDLSPLPLSLKAKRGLRELRVRAGQGENPSLPSDDEQRNVGDPQYAPAMLVDVSRNASLKRMRARVRGTKPSRGNIRLMDGTYLVDERDGEMGVIRIELCDSTDAEDSGVNDRGLRTNLARVGSLSGKVTNVSPNDKGLYRRNSTKPKSGRLVAVKLTPRGASSQREADKERVAFVREVEVLRHISHPNITPLLSHLSTPTHYILVFPYLPGGDLLSLVNSDIMWYLLGEDVLRRIWCELCKAVGWMHGVGLVHRDIKLENIVLTTSAFSSLGPGSSRPTLDTLPAPPTPFIRLSDFGLSRFVDLHPNGEAELLMTRCGSEAYAAPELVTGGGKSHTSASAVDRTKSNGVYDARETDAWACGVVLYALAARRLPFGEGVANDDVVGMSGRKIHDKTKRRQWLMRIAKGEYSWPDVENEGSSADQEDLTGPRLLLSRDARRIVGKLLVRDPGKRARIADLWSDPWMNGTGVDKDLAHGTTSANTVHDFVDEIGSLELEKNNLRNSDVENLDEEKCWLEDEEIEKLEKEEEQDGAWLVDEHRIHSITRQELA
ncbi:hypothetical protein APHAL10511_007136 [Amanita phalloides]|nr:hypothetical protein APHAL10511_007136 [Amanita phalloides]